MRTNFSSSIADGADSRGCPANGALRLDCAHSKFRVVRWSFAAAEGLGHDAAGVSTQPTRIVHHADALDWLADRQLAPDTAVVTSLPDVSEMRGLDFVAWKRWFVEVAASICNAVAKDSVAIFYQTDIKHEGRWVDKNFLVQSAAQSVDAHCLWHKIVCRREPGKVTYGRPAYAHLSCFSRAKLLTPQQSSPDVIPTMGSMTWKRAMGVEACRAAARFLVRHSECTTVVDPFCGFGTMLAVANEFGLHAVGVELSAKRARKAQALSLADVSAPVALRCKTRPE